jgi:hypothetical protein
MSTTISEKCACGASVTVTTTYSDQARRAVDEWREGHKHAESVGICGDMPPFMLGNPAQFPTCELKFGHTGAHGGNGEHWWRIDDDAPTTAGEGERGEGC